MVASFPESITERRRWSSAPPMPCHADGPRSVEWVPVDQLPHASRVKCWCPTPRHSGNHGPVTFALRQQPQLPDFLQVAKTKRRAVSWLESDIHGLRPHSYPDRSNLIFCVRLVW